MRAEIALRVLNGKCGCSRDSSDASRVSARSFLRTLALHVTGAQLVWVTPVEERVTS